MKTLSIFVSDNASTLLLAFGIVAVAATLLASIYSNFQIGGFHI